MTDYTDHVGKKRVPGRLPVRMMTQPGDFFDMIGGNPRSISVIVSGSFQGVGGRRLATFPLRDRVRVMLIDIEAADQPSVEKESEYHVRRAQQERAIAAACRDCISRSEHEKLAELHEAAAVTTRGDDSPQIPDDQAALADWAHARRSPVKALQQRNFSMGDVQTTDGAKPPESETDPSFSPTKVQDLVKAGRDDVDPKETEE